MGLTNAERQKRWRLAHREKPAQQMEKQSMFHKMKVTGPNCAEFITEPLQAMRELNPTLNAMIQSTEQMNKVLCDSGEAAFEEETQDCFIGCGYA